jgi:hypothetical protein
MAAFVSHKWGATGSMTVFLRAMAMPTCEELGHKHKMTINICRLSFFKGSWLEKKKEIIFVCWQKTVHVLTFWTFIMLTI